MRPTEPLGAGATHVVAPGPRRDEREVAVQFEALLFASALKPLADSLGFYGEIVTGALAAGIARSSERATR
jgi:hypothetical protein